MPAPATVAELETHVEHVHGGDIAYYTCSMHPSVQQQGPGTCPICSMGLTPVTREEVETGVIRVDAQRRQEIGVRTAPVTVESVEVTIRAVGTVTYDETELSAVSLKYEGWIGKLYVEETGAHIKKGQPLFRIYSPSMVNAQVDYRITDPDGKGTGREASIRGADQKLRNLEVPQAVIDEMRRFGHDWLGCGVHGT